MNVYPDALDFVGPGRLRAHVLPWLQERQGKIVEAFWSMDNWVEVKKRIDDLLKR
jgi:hypothetical protein